MTQTLSRWRRVLNVGVILLILLGGALAVSAQGGSLPATLSGNEADWDIVPDGGTNDGRPGPNSACFPSATLTGIMLNDAALSSGQDDAFDQAGVWINNRVFTSTTVLVGPSTMTAGPMVTSNGLNVWLDYAALSDTPTLRTLVTVSNTTGSTQPITVTLAINFGSDKTTQYLGTSSGDAFFTSEDRWAVTADGTAVITDVVNTSVIFGGFARITPSFVNNQVFACPGAGDIQGIYAEYQLSVPTGATQRLMFFNQINDTISAAFARVGAFKPLPSAGSPLAAGLTQPQLDQVMNWGPYFEVFLPLIRR
jgi:hypothetical protein